jgi:hypothetical protein
MHKKRKMKTLDFIKEDTGRWYVVLPEWAGQKEALEMVLGADTLLDIAAGNKCKSVRLNISEKQFDGSDELLLTKIDKIEGAFYRLTEFEGKNIDLDMWLCDVTKFVMGGFPEKIYIQSIEFSPKPKSPNIEILEECELPTKSISKTEENIMIQEQSLRRYEEELKQNPDSIFWNGVVKTTKDYIKELKKTTIKNEH